MMPIPMIPGLLRSFGEPLPFRLCADGSPLERDPTEEAVGIEKAVARWIPAGDRPSGREASSVDSSSEEYGARKVSSLSK